MEQTFHTLAWRLSQKSPTRRPISTPAFARQMEMLPTATAAKMGLDVLYFFRCSATSATANKTSRGDASLSSWQAGGRLSSRSGMISPARSNTSILLAAICFTQMLPSSPQDMHDLASATLSVSARSWPFRATVIRPGGSPKKRCLRSHPPAFTTHSSVLAPVLT